jgi:hypothetical protein
MNIIDPEELNNNLNNKIESLKKLNIAIKEARLAGLIIDEPAIYKAISIDATSLFKNETVIECAELKNTVQQAIENIRKWRALFKGK